jgi:hypothetical protein
VPTSADRGSHVVSVTDPYGRILGFLDRYQIIVSRILHNYDLHNLYCSSGIIIMIKSRRMRWAGHIARLIEKGCGILVEKPEGMRSLGRKRSRLVDNTKTNLREIEYDVMD